MTGEPQTQPPLDLTRPMIESEIERLISILDWLDPDPDIEDEGDLEPTEDSEPLYGWTGMEAAYGRYSLEYNGQGADELELDDADKEPSLGSMQTFNQTCWGRYSGHDFEQDCEDEGAQCDDEGWIEEDCCPVDDGSLATWGAGYEEQEATTRACVGAISRVRCLQQRSGQKPIEPLRILGGAIMKGPGS